MHKSNWKEFLLWLFRRRHRYRVRGNSMLPLLKATDEVLVDPRAYRHQAPKIGEIVIARHPTQTDLIIIKRVSESINDGQVQLTGDNPDPTQNSTSLVSKKLILGRVTSRFG